MDRKARAMSRLQSYRELQSSVPGLEEMYEAIGFSLEQQCTDQSNLLIVGGGGGREIELLARTGFHLNVTVVDPSNANLAEARHIADGSSLEGRIEFIEGSVGNLAKDRKFDVISVLMVLHMIQDRSIERDLLTEIRSRMSSSAKIILADLCFDEQASIDALISEYRRNAEQLGTSTSLMSLEAQFASGCSMRNLGRLKAILSEAGLCISRTISTAHWYRCYVVEPAT